MTEAEDTRLTEQQATFAKAYALRANATKAAIAAGYTPSSAGQMGSYLLKLHKVRAAVEKEKKRVGIKMDFTLGRWLEELRRIAYADLVRIAEWDENGIKHIPSADLDEEDSAAINSVKSERKIRTFKGETEETLKMEVKLHDKTKALMMLGQHFGFINTEKSSKEVDVRLTVEQAKAILNADFATQPPKPLEPIKDL